MEALVHAQRQRSLPHETVVVVSNRSDVQGVARATRLGIPVEVVEQERNGTRLSREEHETEVLERLSAYDVEPVSYTHLRAHETN